MLLWTNNTNVPLKYACLKWHCQLIDFICLSMINGIAVDIIIELNIDCDNLGASSAAYF